MSQPSNVVHCDHYSQIRDVTPSTRNGCEDCLKIGGQWVHLRTCQSCGGTHCCDNSPHRHATRHYHATTHEVPAVREDRLDDPFWTAIYQGARRPR